MASVRKQIVIDRPVEDVWSALRDFGALHERLVPGFVVDTVVRGDVRAVTFFNGAIAEERLVGIDDDEHRIAYTVIDGPFAATHHNASAEVSRIEDGRTRFVWTTDVLPDDLAAPIAQLMERGIATIKDTLEDGVMTSSPT
jgi:carbon monoxide dehydrogenase subunit G